MPQTNYHYLMPAGLIALFTALALPATMSAQDKPFDPATLKRFTEGVPYLDKYETGLYPGAKNVIPAAHQKAGEKIAATIRPLDVNGKPDDKEGRILALVFGHSNCFIYFRALEKQLATQKASLNPRFELLNTAVGGQQMPQLVRLQGPVWDLAQKQTSRPGYSAQQVQVLFLHTTFHGAGNPVKRPPGPFPQTMQQMQRDMATLLEHCLKLYPNLKIAYLTCDGFRHFRDLEPHVWQEAFAMKWLIESQIKGESGTAFEGANRKLPWLQWGPYIWDNSWDQSYFTDGVHPAAKAQEIFVKAYWDFLRQDPVAKPWLLKTQ